MDIAACGSCPEHIGSPDIRVLLRIHLESAAVNVDKVRTGPGLGNCLGRCDKRMRYCQYNVARLNAAAISAKSRASVPLFTPTQYLVSQYWANSSFESFYFRTPNKASRFNRSLKHFEQFGFKFSMKCHEINKRNFFVLLSLVTFDGFEVERKIFAGLPATIDIGRHIAGYNASCSNDRVFTDHDLGENG